MSHRLKLFSQICIRRPHRVRAQIASFVLEKNLVSYNLTRKVTWAPLATPMSSKMMCRQKCRTRDTYCTFLQKHHFGVDCGPLNLANSRSNSVGCQGVPTDFGRMGHHNVHFYMGKQPKRIAMCGFTRVYATINDTLRPMN